MTAPPAGRSGPAGRGSSRCPPACRAAATVSRTVSPSRTIARSTWRSSGGSACRARSRSASDPAGERLVLGGRGHGRRRSAPAAPAPVGPGGGTRRPGGARRSSTASPPRCRSVGRLRLAAGRPPDRQVGLLQHLGDHVLVGAAAAQPHRQPRRRYAGTARRTRAGRPGRRGEEFALVEPVQTSSHTRQDDAYPGPGSDSAVTPSHWTRRACAGVTPHTPGTSSVAEALPSERITLGSSPHPAAPATTPASSRPRCPPSGIPHRAATSTRSR